MKCTIPLYSTLIMESMAISSPPPLYSPPSDDKAKSTLIQKFHYYPESKKSLQQPKYPLSTCFQKYDFPSLINPSTQSTVEPIIMPIVIPQTATAPLPCQLMSDKPVNVTFLQMWNHGKEEGLAENYSNFTCQYALPTTFIFMLLFFMYSCGLLPRVFRLSSYFKKRTLSILNQLKGNYLALKNHRISLFIWITVSSM
ncbi:FERM and PDZ domain-containing protein [Dirofilaria immitis]